MDPIQTLMNEHRVIETVLAALEAADTQDIPFSFYARAADFIRHYADGCHHAKEEGQFFPLLEEKGIPRRSGPIGVMCEEHEIGRGLVRLMCTAVEKEDRVQVRRAARDYCALLRQHIMKEDNVLFPMGRSALSPLELDNLGATFEDIGCDTKYEQLSKELLAEAGL